MNGSYNYYRFLQGDEDGLVEIIREYKDGLIFYLNTFTNDIFVAEELAMDTFVKIGIKKLKDKKYASFKTWLYTIGKNTAIDYLRKNSKKNIPLDDKNIFSESILETILKDERKIIIHKAMNNLKMEYKQVLWLAYFEKFSNKEISIIMNKKVHNVETFLYRAKKSLKKELEMEEYFYENL